MTIKTHFKNNIKYILITEKLKNEDYDQFFEETNDSHRELEIIFLDSKILSSIFVEELAHIKESKGDSLKIIVNDTDLSFYLSALGIKNVLGNHETKYESTRQSKEYLGNYLIQDVEYEAEEVSDFLNELFNKFGNDFRNYNIGSVIRRINVTRIKLNINTFYKFRKDILEGGEAYHEFLGQMSINTTEFFRDPGQIKVLKEQVLTYLNSFPEIKIWSAGCSTGEEAYSIAILLDEAGLLSKSIIYATDFNNLALKKAENGLYSIDSVNNGAKNYFASGGEKSYFNYFIKTGNFYKTEPKLKKHIAFLNHNLGTDGVFNEFQLIICRNVLIYFDSILETKVIHLFHDSLHRNGFLMLGKSEGAILLSEKKIFFPLLEKFKLYKKGCLNET